MQNRHAMPPEARADFERALATVEGDAVFLTRLERYFTDLRDPLVELYGGDPRFAEQWPALLRRDRGHRRGPRGRAARRSTTSARSRRTGCTASTRSATSPTSTASPGRCTACASGCPTCASSASTTCTSCRCCGRGRRPTTAATRSPTTAPSSPRWARWTTCARSPRTCTRTAWRCASTSSLNHTAREHAWAQAALAGDEHKLAFYRTFPDRTKPDAYEATLPEVFPDIAPGNFTWVPELGRWVWTTFNDLQWDLDYTNPEVFARDGRGRCSSLAAVGVDVLRLDAVPFLWKRQGTDCQNQPEVHQLLQAFRAAAADRGAGAWPSRPRRSSPRASSSPTWASAATRARSATSPTTTCSWSCCGARWPRGRVALMTHALRAHAARPAAARAG